jgi:hypothetical protein
MKKIFLFSVLFYSITAIAQDCTEESRLKEPGRFLDAHTGKKLSGASYTSAETATASKMLTAFEKVCKANLQFQGGQAKASFLMNTRSRYNQSQVPSYMYNLGFHAFACNVVTHKLAVVDEYMGVLRVTANPDFNLTFSIDRNNEAYRIPANTANVNAPLINICSYYGFADNKLVSLINNGNQFFDHTTNGVNEQGTILEIKPGKGYGYTTSNGFITMNNELLFRVAYLTHADIPFFIPISRKKFLTDLLEYYDREKPVLTSAVQENIKKLKATIAESEKTNSPYLANQKERLALFEQSAREIPTVNEAKKQAATKLLQTNDEKWLSQQAVVKFENKSFTLPLDRKRNMEEVYGRFYFTDFYTGTEGINLYQINPDYIKKYPPTGPKPSLILVRYRFRPNDKFLMSVMDDYINKLNLEEFRKLL